MDAEQESTHSDQQSESAEDTRTEAATSQEPTTLSGKEVLDELGRLGVKLVEVVDTAWNSEQRKRIQEDVRLGITAVAKSLEEGLHELSEHEQTQEIIGKAEDVAEEVSSRVRSSEITKELADGLAKGLHILGDQLEHLVAEMKASGAPAADAAEAPQNTGDSEPQDIPIQNE